MIVLSGQTGLVRLMAREAGRVRPGLSTPAARRRELRDPAAPRGPRQHQLAARPRPACRRSGGRRSRGRLPRTDGPRSATLAARRAVTSCRLFSTGTDGVVDGVDQEGRRGAGPVHPLQRPPGDLLGRRRSGPAVARAIRRGRTARPWSPPDTSGSTGRAGTTASSASSTGVIDGVLAAAISRRPDDRRPRRPARRPGSGSRPYSAARARTSRSARWASCSGASGPAAQPSAGQAVTQDETGDARRGEDRAHVAALLVHHRPAVAAARDQQQRGAVRPLGPQDRQDRVGGVLGEPVVEGRVGRAFGDLRRDGDVAPARRPFRPQVDDFRRIPAARWSASPVSSRERGRGVAARAARPSAPLRFSIMGSVS